MENEICVDLESVKYADYIEWYVKKNFPRAKAFRKSGTTKIVISYYRKKDMAIFVDLLARKGKKVDFDESTAAYLNK